MNANKDLSIAPTRSIAMDGTVAPRTQQVVATVCPPSSKRLRSDLLNKLGIVDERSQQAPTAPAEPKTLLGPIKVIKAPLKLDEGPALNIHPTVSIFESLGSFFRVGSPSMASAAMTNDSDDSSTISSTSANERRRLTFDEEVSVVLIPRRQEYSNRIKEHLWNPAEVLQCDIARNTIEYAADGWKWEQVREEEDYVLNRESGELIHPIHQEIANLIRQEQGLPDGTPVWTPFLKQSQIGSCSAPPTTSSRDD